MLECVLPGLFAGYRLLRCLNLPIVRLKILSIERVLKGKLEEPGRLVSTLPSLQAKMVVKLASKRLQPFLYYRLVQMYAEYHVLLNIWNCAPSFETFNIKSTNRELVVFGMWYGNMIHMNLHQQLTGSITLILFAKKNWNCWLQIGRRLFYLKKSGEVIEKGSGRKYQYFGATTTPLQYSWMPFWRALWTDNITYIFTFNVNINSHLSKVNTYKYYRFHITSSRNGLMSIKSSRQ